MRIAVDVMGGDYGCGVVIEGAKRALQADKTITNAIIYGLRKDEHHLPPQLVEYSAEPRKHGWKVPHFQFGQTGAEDP